MKECVARESKNKATEEREKKGKRRWKSMREINNGGVQRRGGEEGRNKRGEC